MGNDNRRHGRERHFVELDYVVLAVSLEDFIAFAACSNAVKTGVAVSRVIHTNIVFCNFNGPGVLVDVLGCRHDWFRQHWNAKSLQYS